MDIQLLKSPDELTGGFLSLSSPEDVASLLEIPYQVLNYHLYVTKPSEQYATFSIPKKQGGVREIYAPMTTLKIIQKKLNFILQNVYKKIYEKKICVHGFIYGKNVQTNALTHAKKEYVFNIDISDFFPSINFGRVYGLFMGKPYNLSKSVASVLARICAFKDLSHDLLPQGAPTSPIISNMICARMDDELYRFARRFNCKYTRYADDITFSTDRSHFPEE
ncbi:MAG: reverse transcriptase domain-containing protein, partial [Planctomycetota bacterium]|nr:reverse transcriptase domain-containing protein [Planctomycetota bacterium]